MAPTDTYAMRRLLLNLRIQMMMRIMVKLMATVKVKMAAVRL